MVICQWVTVLVQGCTMVICWLTMRDMHASPSPLDTSCKTHTHTHTGKSSVAQQSTRRFILGRAPWFNIWVAVTKQLRPACTLDPPQVGDWTAGGVIPASPELLFTDQFRTLESASQQRGKRKPSPSLVRKHQKTDRGADWSTFLSLCS